VRCWHLNRPQMYLEAASVRDCGVHGWSHVPCSMLLQAVPPPRTSEYRVRCTMSHHLSAATWCKVSYQCHCLQCQLHSSLKLGTHLF
jgi:hypothetical protein